MAPPKPRRRKFNFYPESFSAFLKTKSFLEKKGVPGRSSGDVRTLLRVQDL
jgi:hypothetical protein